MKKTPILFSASMVEAILDGSKTQSRRAINPQPTLLINAEKHSTYLYRGGLYALDMYKENSNILKKCPFGQIGDQLWVRETWAPVNLYGEIALAYKADSEVIRVAENESFLDEDGLINYEDPRLEKYSFATWAQDLLSGTEGRWKPSIHMPRWASRILLEVTNIRVERLQDISKEDAKSEGFDYSTHSSAIEMGYAIGARTNFRHKWEEIYGHSEWNKNPWVWVLEFKAINSKE